MGGEFIANDDGVVKIEFIRSDGSTRTLRLSGFEAGEEVYADVLEGRFR